MATRNYSSALTSVLSAAALLGAGILIGRTTTLAAHRPSVLLMPAPAECAAAWQKDLKVAIESGTGAKMRRSQDLRTIL
jgi:hypothetical protein